MFGSLGLPELLIIGGLIIVLFGAKKLPQLGEGMGKGIRNFKSALGGSEDNQVEDSTKSTEKQNS